MPKGNKKPATALEKTFLARLLHKIIPLLLLSRMSGESKGGSTIKMLFTGVPSSPMKCHSN